MDGTLADFYGISEWQKYLNNYNPLPYIQAKPLFNMRVLARLLNKLLKQGKEIYIISWLSKNTNTNFDAAVKAAKLQWLKKHLKSVHFTDIYIIPYGTPKNLYGNGVLFDDEEKNRVNWGDNAFEPKDIIKLLKEYSKEN